MQVARVPQNNGNALVRRTVPADEIPARISHLYAPIILLSGHEGEILTCQFNPDGNLLASGSFDKSILLWSVFGEECKSIRLMKNGHENAILDIKWTADSGLLCSASADQTVALWDCESGLRIKRFKGHSGVVNSVAIAGPSSSIASSIDMIISGSDDGLVKVWDSRQKFAVCNLDMGGSPITSVAYAAGRIFAGSTDNTIACWDWKSFTKSFELQGHVDTISGLSVSPDENSLLSNSFDSTLRLWDIRPFSTIPNRQLGTYNGAPHTSDKSLIKPCFSADGKYIASGAGDRTVVIWDRDSAEILYKLPGHKGTVTQVAWNSKEPIIASCSTDRQIFLGEVKLD